MREAAAGVYRTWRQELERRVEAERHRIPVRSDRVGLFFKVQEPTRIKDKLVHFPQCWGSGSGRIRIIFFAGSEVFTINQKYLLSKKLRYDTPDTGTVLLCANFLGTEEMIGRKCFDI